MVMKYGLLATLLLLQEQVVADRLKADIRGAFVDGVVIGDNQFKARVEARDDRDPGQGTWKVRITRRSTALEEACPLGLNWHIHTKKIGTPSETDPLGCGTTGGHDDNGFACGAASEWNDTTCTALDYAPYGERCSNERQKGCEYGDLSGKLGKIQYTRSNQFYNDDHLETLETYKATSLVLHCCRPKDDGTADCKARVACADFRFSG